VHLLKGMIAEAAKFPAQDPLGSSVPAGPCPTPQPLLIGLHYTSGLRASQHVHCKKRRVYGTHRLWSVIINPFLKLAPAPRSPLLRCCCSPRAFGAVCHLP
jgi:hypothetical protein